ncbi:MAG TPA: aldo/keto reductase, partial [Burkholderiales bacterium]|nr:aldo/keto reductase [Burkholderiales bacterium]
MTTTREAALLSPSGRRTFLRNWGALGAVATLGRWTGAGSAYAAVNDYTSVRGEQMKQRKLGAMQVSEIGAGCMSISANYGPPAPKEQALKTIRAAFENGVTLFDTAEV